MTYEQMRQEFETWAKNDQGFDDDDLKRWPDDGFLAGAYENLGVAMMWAAWRDSARKYGAVDEPAPA